MHFLRISLLVLLLLASLVNFFPVPTHLLWYVGIAVPEYCWIFMLAALLLATWSWRARKARVVGVVMGLVIFLLYSYPVIMAYRIGATIDSQLNKSFGIGSPVLPATHQPAPFRFTQMFTGNGTRKIPYQVYEYAVHTGEKLTLHFTPSVLSGVRPCLVVVHGGSWRGGDNTELEKVNNYYANAGYQVASINYRLAPRFTSPAPQEDLHAALAWLRSHSTELKIDTSNFVLMGRSAGAQIVLIMAYSGQESGIKGVAAFYGPTDMFYSYRNPSHIIDSRKIQTDFLGGDSVTARTRFVAESAVLQVTAQSPPTLLVHGKQDAHVWDYQAQRLSAELNAYHIPNMALLLPWGTHGCEYNLNGPGGQLSIYAVERFFHRYTAR